MALEKDLTLPPSMRKDSSQNLSCTHCCTGQTSHSPPRGPKSEAPGALNHCFTVPTWELRTKIEITMGSSVGGKCWGWEAGAFPDTTREGGLCPDHPPSRRRWTLNGKGRLAMVIGVLWAFRFAGPSTTLAAHTTPAASSCPSTFLPSTDVTAPETPQLFQGLLAQVTLWLLQASLCEQG